MPRTEHFDALLSHYHACPDRMGEVWIGCPSCGRKAEDKKCSFSEKGWHCFICGEGGSLSDLQERIGAAPPKEPYRYTEHETTTDPPKHYLWQDQGVTLIERYTSEPDVGSLWRGYRPFTEETIEKHKLGVGVLPSCRCRHKRLIYPAIRMDGSLAALRARSTECECGKWLQAAGSKVILWGAQYVGQSDVVIVCESPVDAMLVMQTFPEYAAIAGSGGAGTWWDPWTELLVNAAPEFVIVWYDNDLAGSATGKVRADLAREWCTRHPEAKRLPRANGPWVANTLLKAGLPVQLYKWGADVPPKTDLSDYIMQEYYARQMA